ncbi:MAG TPA: hypothetical protein P5181_15355 [Dermatophilaceae bacterium]|nr:hypothetical protein [Dermatophilaceae bacterium]
MPDGPATGAERGAGPERGVVFPIEGARRATSTTGRGVVADALRAVDPVGARAAAGEANWRAAYPVHFRRLVEAGLDPAEDALSIARSGLASVHERMLWCRPDGMDVPLPEARHAPGRDLMTETVTGAGEPERTLRLPYRGQRLEGAALLRQLDAWVAAGVIEPGCAEAVRAVAAHPDWLDLRDERVVVLGAAAEMAPLRSLLRWGAEVLAVDLPVPELWRRLIDDSARYAGRLHVAADADRGGADLAGRVGADLVTEWPAVARWLGEQPGRLVLANAVYADGATNVRVSVAVDLLTEQLRKHRPDTALSFLATPTDVFAVPGADVARSVAAYEHASVSRVLRGPLRTISGGRLLTRAYVPGADPGINDSIVPQQGPNYLLAKRIQRWRATVARAEGVTVSLNVAPPTRTRSVVKNRALAAAYAGAHRFGIEVFEPATSNTLMAALLVHDLRTGVTTLGDPWRDEAARAAHGGLWTTAYAPRSALGLAALLGVGSR